MRTLLPRVSLDVSRPIADPGSLFCRRPSALWLEIGFGGGEHLAAVAAAHPDAGYIGCEYFVNGVAKALAQIEACGLHNIRIHMGDARAVVGSLPPQSLGGVYVLYPDPWPKRRHRKRRLLSPEMLAELAGAMRSGAELRYATDIDSNAAWTLAQILHSSDFVWQPADARDWQAPWDGWCGTRYEAKALREGRKPVYLTFRKLPCSA